MSGRVISGFNAGCKTGSRLERLLAAGHFVVTGELGPPKAGDGTQLVQRAGELKDVCDAFNITDNQTAIVRLSSIAAGVHVLRGGGVPIIQMTCRDRNRIALQSDILGAYSLGLRDILCLSGDHQSFGNHPASKNVYDLDSVQLIALVKKMRDEEQFLSGDKIEAAPKFYIGAAANPFGDPLELRLLRLEKKINAGADFIQTQAVFDLERFARFMELVAAGGLHERVNIMAGILPPRSAKALRYMQTSIAGMSIPDELIARMEKAADPRREGVAIAVELIREIKKIPGVRGIHIMPVGWEAVLPEIVGRAGLLPRPR